MILRYDQRIFEAAAKKESRYTMNGIRFITNGSGTYATGTDGKTLVTVEVLLESGESLPEEGVILSASDLKDGWGRGQMDRQLRYTAEGWKLTAGAQTSAVKELEGDFPNVAAVTPEPVSGRHMTIDVKLLAKMAKAAGTERVTLEIPDFDGGHVRSPIRVRMNDTFSPTDMGVIMPIVLD